MALGNCVPGDGYVWEVTFNDDILGDGDTSGSGIHLKSAAQFM